MKITRASLELKLEDKEVYRTPHTTCRNIGALIPHTVSDNRHKNKCAQTIYRTRYNRVLFVKCLFSDSIAIQGNRP